MQPGAKERRQREVDNRFGSEHVEDGQVEQETSSPVNELPEAGVLRLDKKGAEDVEQRLKEYPHQFGDHVSEKDRFVTSGDIDVYVLDTLGVDERRLCYNTYIQQQQIIVNTNHTSAQQLPKIRL